MKVFRETPPIKKFTPITLTIVFETAKECDVIRCWARNHGISGESYLSELARQLFSALEVATKERLE